MRAMSAFIQQTTSSITTATNEINQHHQPRNSKIILDQLMSIVRECQIKYGGKTELATEQDPKIVRLCLAWERTLCHGIKQNGIVQNVTGLISGQFSMEQPNFWTFAYQHLTKHEKERFSTLRHIWTDRGKIMALLRAALNERSLQRYVLVWLNDDSIKSFYDDWSIMRDNEATNLLPTIAGGLDSILFAVAVDCPDLNIIQATTKDSRVEPIISTPHPAELSATRTIVSTKRKIISFDKDEEDDNEEAATTSSISPAMSACGSMPKSLSSMCLKFNEQSVTSNGFSSSENQAIIATSSSASLTNVQSEDIYVAAPESPSSVQIIERTRRKSSTTINDLLSKYNFEIADVVLAAPQKLHNDSGITEECGTMMTASSERTSSSKHSSIHSSMESIKSLTNDDSAVLKLRLQESLDRCSMLENRVAELSLENHRLRGLANPSRYGFNYFSVSVPRVLLQRNQRKKYYAYEVHIIPTHGGDEWTLLRRYNEFYKLHKHFQKDNVAIKTLDFPPKKKFGNMDAHFVEQRRQRLQVYLRHLLALLPDVARCQTRSHLEQCFPFFK